MKKSKCIKRSSEVRNISRLVITAVVAISIGVLFADYSYAWSKDKSKGKSVKVAAAKVVKASKKVVLGDPGAGDKAKFGDVTVNTISGDGAGLTGIPASGIDGTAVVTNDSRLTDARVPLAHDQAWSTITSTPVSLAGYGITDTVVSVESDPVVGAVTGLIKANGAGAISAAEAGVDYVASESDPVWSGVASTVVYTNNASLTVGGRILIETSGITSTVYVVSDTGVTNVMGTYWKE